jgi:hypothetical protein
MGFMGIGMGVVDCVCQIYSQIETYEGHGGVLDNFIRRVINCVRRRRQGGK